MTEKSYEESHFRKFNKGAATLPTATVFFGRPRSGVNKFKLRHRTSPSLSSPDVSVMVSLLGADKLHPEA
eukprot:g48320.t1